MYSFRTFNRRALRGFALLIFLTLAASPALATRVSCISSSAAFADELNATGIYLEDFEIHLTEGTFKVGQGTVYENLKILGGYSYPDCFSRSLVPGKTVITSITGTPSDYVRLDTDNSSTLTIDAITFTAPFTTGIFGEFGAAGTITISRSVFTGIGGGQFSPLFVGWFPEDGASNLDLRIVDSLFVDNSVTTPCVIDLSSSWGGASFTLINNTVMNNPNATQGGVCVTTYSSADFPAYTVLLAHDNIFYGNTNGGVDVYANTSYLELVDNIIHTQDTPPPYNFPTVGTRTANPQLDANYKPLSSPTSPTINTGEYDTGDTTPTDLDGGPRIIGSRVDRGAYESAIDDAFLLSVTNANDHGTGSLRDALNSANQNAADGAHFISFDIGTGCGPHVIELETPLPQITSTMIISGVSQPGASENTLDVGDDATLCIILDGNANHIADGIYVPASAPVGTQLILYDIAFGTFTHSAVGIYGGTGHSIKGLHIGGNVGGFDLFPAANGIVVGPGVSGVSIGGHYPSNRNVVGSAQNDGIVLTGPNASNAAAHGNTIVNNYVGVGWNKTNSVYVNRGNTLNGIHVAGYNNTISDNLVGYNGYGITLGGANAHDNTVTGNAVGEDALGAAIGNNAGVLIDQSAHDNSIQANTIASNFYGVWAKSGLGNSIRKNNIKNNGYIGIDLGGDGVTPNDNDDAVGAQLLPNRELNFPVIGLATGVAHDGVVTGGLTTTGGDYIIDVYSTPSCNADNRQGARWLGSRKITRASAGGLPTPFRVPFTLQAPLSIAFGAAITVTATDAAGNSFPGNTSEFSACVSYTNDRIFANGFN